MQKLFQNTERKYKNTIRIIFIAKLNDETKTGCMDGINSVVLKYWVPSFLTVENLSFSKKILRFL